MAVLKVEKIKVKYDENYKGIAVKCEDNTPLSSALDALIAFEKKDSKSKEYLDKAFEQKNVGIHVKAYSRFMPMGYVSLLTFNKYKQTIN